MKYTGATAQLSSAPVQFAILAPAAPCRCCEILDGSPNRLALTLDGTGDFLTDRMLLEKHLHVRPAFDQIRTDLL